MRHAVLRSTLLPILLALAAAGLTTPTAGSERKPFPPDDAPRILVLGDSITFAGHYVALLEAHLRQARPDVPWQIVNVGLPSETCTGLSEPDHPFPRPNVHERLQRALDKFQPAAVVACYGMNDGIYYPFSEERFEAYQQGIQKLIAAVRQRDVPLVLMAPPPFDPLPLRAQGKLRGKDADKFAWFAIYEDYDQVLARYADWIMSLQDGVRMTIDLHTPVNRYVRAKRRQDKDFTMSPDGVHLNREGHRVLAAAILSAWGYDPDQPIDPGVLELIERRQVLLRDAWLSHIGHKRPGMKAGLPLSEAEAEAAELDQRIREAMSASRDASGN